jgi:serine/threonine protein kinase
MNPAHAIDDRRGPAGIRSPAGRALPRGTRLREYELADVVGEAGFSIVYRAWDTTLHRRVAVKEYLPASMATRSPGSATLTVSSERHRDIYDAGLKSFVAEARLLARFDHASLVKVYRFWEENGTAYMVMPFYEGPTLEQALAELDHVPG